MILIKLKAFLFQFPFIVPRKIIISCEDWIKNNFRIQGNYLGIRGPWFKNIHPSSFLHLSPPKTVGFVNHTAFKGNQNFYTGNSNLFYLQNCFLLGHMGLILTKKNEVFQEFTHNFNISGLKKFFYKNPFYTYSSKFIKAGFTGAVLISPQRQNYYHWISDVLPRIKLYEDVFNEIDYFCVPSNVPTKFLDLLPNFGINKEKLYLVNEKEKIFFDHLFVASLPGSEGRAPIWAINYLREKLVKINESTPREKFYIKRGIGTKRQVVNEVKVIEVLEQKGFKIINPDELTVFDQIKLMEKAKVVISVHGAALTNLLFVNKNTSVIEIFSSDYFRTDCFYTISAMQNLNYYYLIGEKNKISSWGDVTINIDLLLKTITEIN